MEKAVTSVLFVCLGNICRSPTAHGVFVALLERHGLSDVITVDSCGTGDWHINSPPDSRATAAAASRGYDLSDLRARQVQRQDFAVYDYILAMDGANLSDLKALCPEDYPGHLGLFLAFAKDIDIEDVPDPYYGGSDGFSQVLDLIEAASEGLLHAINTEQIRDDEAALR